MSIAFRFDPAGTSSQAAKPAGGSFASRPYYKNTFAPAQWNVQRIAVSCPADLDGDGNVGVGDLLALLGQRGADPEGPPDFDGNDNVGVSDLLVLLAKWGPCP